MGAMSTAATTELSPDAREERMKALLSVIDLMRPVIQQDGGDLALVSADVEVGTVAVMLQGSCSSCAVSSSTLQAGVSRILKDRLPWVTEVNGTLEELDEEVSRSMVPFLSTTHFIVRVITWHA